MFDDIVITGASNEANIISVEYDFDRSKILIFKRGETIEVVEEEFKPYIICSSKLFEFFDGDFEVFKEILKRLLLVFLLVVVISKEKEECKKPQLCPCPYDIQFKIIVQISTYNGKYK